MVILYYYYALTNYKLKIKVAKCHLLCIKHV